MQVIKIISRREKRFYSNVLQILLQFDRNGQLSGFLRFPKGSSSFSKEFDGGLYCNNGSRISFVFFNQTAEIITCYSGEIFKYSAGDECLILKYWTMNELLPSSEPFTNSRSLLLFNCSEKDPIAETRKVIEKIPFDVLSNLFSDSFATAKRGATLSGYGGNHRA